MILRPEPFWISNKSDIFFKQQFPKLDLDLINKFAWLVSHPKRSRVLYFNKKINFSKLSPEKPISEEVLSYMLLSNGYLTGFPDQLSITLSAVIPNTEMCFKLNNLILEHL